MDTENRRRPAILFFGASSFEHGFEKGKLVGLVANLALEMIHPCAVHLEAFAQEGRERT